MHGEWAVSPARSRVFPNNDGLATTHSCDEAASGPHVSIMVAILKGVAVAASDDGHVDPLDGANRSKAAADLALRPTHCTFDDATIHSGARLFQRHGQA